METFVCLKAALDAISRGGLYPTLVNSANELLVELFLKGKVSFLQIGDLVCEVLGERCDGPVTLENILAAEEQARQFVLSKNLISGGHMKSILLTLLIFAAIIIIHECGHFFAARLCGVRVNEFAIGMGPTLLRFGKKETRYSWRLFPIGGFVAMEGGERPIR